MRCNVLKRRTSSSRSIHQRNRFTQWITDYVWWDRCSLPVPTTSTLSVIVWRAYGKKNGNGVDRHTSAPVVKRWSRWSATSSIHQHCSRVSRDAQKTWHRQACKTGSAPRSSATTETHPGH
ncbi:hypothetical protein LINGRAHAP2_LOCUS24536 [Linum grandiflorum]